MEQTQSLPAKAVRPSFVDALELVTKATPLMLSATYLVGFLVMASHLSSLGIYDSAFWDTSYLVAGCHLLIITGPLLLIIAYCNPDPTDNLTKAWRGVVVTIIISACYGLFVSAVFFNKPLDSFHMPWFLAFIAACLYRSSYAARNVKRWLADAFLALPLVGLFLTMVFRGNWYHLGFAIGIVYLAVYFLTFYGEWGDGVIDKVRVAFGMIALLCAVCLYGSLLYKHVPKKLGGGEAIMKRLIMDSSANARMKEIPKTIRKLLTDQVTLVHETTDRYFVSMPGQGVIALDKTLFVGEIAEIKKYKSLTHKV
jgi:hypothetical protein